MSPTGSSPYIEELEWLRHFAARLATPGDEDDLVQDTLVAAWQRGPADEPSRSSRPWLATVARNRARMDHRARQRRQQREHEVGEAAAKPGPDDELERVAILRALLAALDELPELDRKIIVRRFFEGENATQIGEQLGIPAATVRSRLRRSLAQLRERLDERFEARERWALVWVGPSTSFITPTTGATTMSMAIKVGLGIAIMGLTTAGWWWSRDTSPASGDEPGRGSTASVTNAGEAEVEPPPEDRARQAWEQRRDRIRSAHARRPVLVADANDDEAADPSTDERAAIERAVIMQAGSEFSALRRACVADLDSDASGAISLYAHLIGDPEIGVVFDSIEIVTETVGDPEVLACLTESMYAYVGDKPPMLIDAHYAPTIPWIGRDEDDTRKQRRIFDSIVGAHHGEVAFCGREHGPDEIGTLELELTVGSERHIEQADIVVSALPKPVVDCIVAATQRWIFPADLAGMMFTYRFRVPVPGLADLMMQPDQ